MNLKIAIVGLPNAGKSTLFNALLKRQVADVANYPFTTIEPNIGVVPVPDPRLAKLAQIYKSPIIPAVVEFVDVAGLVKGASEGQGLGNKFLSHIRETHIVVNVLRFFQDPSVVHVAGDVDPERDRKIIETEFILADLQTLAKQPDSEIVTNLKVQLEQGKVARDVIDDPEDVRDLHLLTMKPVLYVANVSEDQLTSRFVIPATEPGSSSSDGMPDQVRHDMIMISAKTESELATMSEDEQKAYLKELGLEASGLDRLIAKAYEMLGLISFLTCGVKEVRAWTLRRGETALRASGVIHTDFMKSFIKADVISFNDFVEAGGWVKARELGKVRSEGKEYEMKDGDVVEFKVGA
ncbi:redox-regulated ATPase YchF [Candidatus Gottesmanbacteria bacterium RIFCSPLOWO2_01_FULL_43_11b]|uniref:Ribosome-binding ATPase YchF n=1 Tax=Candidatus Gottesmanbacteria bacterium RIFCSPLOWO2_01_FULL_43_11b TaxID=1798392 RepID=A0A1F6AG53_9BACT|nr:MAG: redox-regulated ATPase YchF [Candidatus Gottesmanbacteria bacterium RIFCSPLOWO2_01_FULL_43_11b]